MSPGTDPAAAGEIAWEEDGTGPVLRFSGVIGREAVRRFRRLVPPASWPARADLGAVTTLDAAGIELLVHLARKPRRRGGELELVALPTHLGPVLARAGLSRLVPRPDGTPTSA
ncbi:STAS domain-containing protein [Modestobacter versicolor]|uniref:STAS domain-containing protein n=1 Tax=Modestobacter versicolor TaxID=429133 RepID=UPI0034DFFA3D